METPIELVARQRSTILLLYIYSFPSLPYHLPSTLQKVIYS
jgi:hypothetical protein